MVTTLVHMSDLHILDLTGVTWRRYLNKRLTGAANLLMNRGAAHPIAMAEALVADVKAQAPDHVAITGDLTNLAFDSEFAKAAEVLEPLGGYDDVSVIPGNHDIYTQGSLRDRRFEKHFGHLMWRDGAERTYPWVKTVGDDLSLVGFRSAHPVAPLFAHGWVDDGQLGALGGHLGEDGRFVVGMVHHNLHRRSPRKTWMHGLRNREQVLDSCAGSGMGMLLHGHTHVAHRFEHKGMAVVGCGSSTWLSEEPSHVGRYNLYRFERTDDGVSLLDMQVRIYDAASQTFQPGGTLTVQ